MSRSWFRRLLPVVIAAWTLSCGAGETEPIILPPEGTPSGPHDGFQVSSPAAEGMDTIALRALVDSAMGQKSDALVIIKNGRLVYENYFGKSDEQIGLMSASKSMISLAVGFLIDDGKLTTLDLPVVQVLPAFATSDPRKASITIRHLLTNASGIDPTRAYAKGNDIEKWANESRSLWAPGTSSQYCNNGFDILALVVQEIAGQRLDIYLYQKLLAPLGIPAREGAWYFDSRSVAYGAGDMQLRPIELAKIGQMILDGGVYNGKRVISDDWLRQSFLPGNPFRLDYGLGWWLPVNAPSSFSVTHDLLVQWVGNGLPQSIADKLAPIVGKPFSSPAEVSQAIQLQLSSGELETLSTLQATGDHIDQYRQISGGPGKSYYAYGYLGQYLDIVFDKHAVAVRMRRSSPTDPQPPRREDEFGKFIALALRAFP